MISKETHIKIVLEMAGLGVLGKVPKMMNVEKILLIILKSLS